MPTRKNKNKIVQHYKVSLTYRLTHKTKKETKACMLTNSAAIQAQIQHFESVFHNIYSIYKLLE